MAAASAAEPKLMGGHMGLPLRFQCEHDELLEGAVCDCRDSQGSKLGASGFGNTGPADRHRALAYGQSLCELSLLSVREVLLTVNAGGSFPPAVLGCPADCKAAGRPAFSQKLLKSVCFGATILFRFAEYPLLQFEDLRLGASPVDVFPLFGSIRHKYVRLLLIRPLPRIRRIPAITAWAFAWSRLLPDSSIRLASLVALQRQGCCQCPRFQRGDLRRIRWGPDCGNLQG